MVLIDHRTLVQALGRRHCLSAYRHIAPQLKYANTLPCRSISSPFSFSFSLHDNHDFTMKFSTILVVAGAAVTTVVGRVVFNPPAPFNTSAFTTYNKFNAGLPSGHRILQITTDPADDQQWQAAVCKGEQLLQGIKGTDAEAGQLFNPPMSSAQSEFRQFPRKSSSHRQA